MHKILLLFSLLCCILLQPLLTTAQQISTVAISNNIGSGNLEITTTAKTISFPINTIPTGAIVRSCSLVLTVAKDIIPQKSMKIKTNGTERVQYFSTTFKADTVVQISLDSSVIRDTSINLELSLLKDAIEFKNDKSKPGECPHLVVTYAYKSAPIPWASSQANAQHTSNTYMRIAGVNPNSLTSTTIDLNEKILTNLVMYQNKIYLVSNANNETKLMAVDINSKEVTQVQTLDPLKDKELYASKGIMPAISTAGLLYYISENYVQVIDIQAATPSIIKQIGVSNLKTVVAAPTIGKDGTLYLALNDIIYAYSPRPQYQLLWQYSPKTGTGAKSPITLNKEGTIAYFVDYKSKKLIALNTINGREIRISSQEVVGEIPTNENPTIPMVNNYGNIYVCNRLQDGTKMSIFDKNMNLIRVITGAKISRPVAGAGTNLGAAEDSLAFFLKNGYLMRTNPYKTKDSIFVASDLVAYSLIADASNNVYCLSTNKQIYPIYNNPKLDIMSPSFPLPEAAQKAMIIAPDGTLYTASTFSLYKILPSSFGGKSFNFSDAGGDSNKDDIVFRADYVTINRSLTSANQRFIGTNLTTVNNITIEEKASVTIGVGKNGVKFQNGFSVKTGATLSCKTGY